MTDTQSDLHAMFEAMTAAIRAQVLTEQKTTQPTPNTPRLLTAAEAGAYLGRTESAIRQLIHKKQIPIVRFGRNVRIDRNDLDKLIEEYKQ